MIIDAKAPDGQPWHEPTLHALGARTITDRLNEAGDATTGYDVAPDIDLSGYAAAVAAHRRADLAAHAAATRYRYETGGTTVGGKPVHTDRQSQGLINGLFTMANLNPQMVSTFKYADGTFDMVDAAGITAIAVAVGTHVQGCFAQEAAVLTGIDAGTVMVRADIDAAFAAVYPPPAGATA